MEENATQLVNHCSFAGIRPIMVDLPYPPIQAEQKNPVYANLLSIDYCGSVSEMSAITQYINNENRISGEKCALAKTLLGIAMAEMMHLQKLGELIQLLGGTVDFTARRQTVHVDTGISRPPRVHWKDAVGGHRIRKVCHQPIQNTYQYDPGSLRQCCIGPNHKR